MSATARRNPKAPQQTASRKDPRQIRRVSYELQFTQLTNPDPNMHYIFAAKYGDKGIGYWEGLGYTVVPWPNPEDKTHVRVKGVSRGTPGSQQEFHGQILMQIAKEKREEIDQYGAYDIGGQLAADELEEKIIDKRPGQSDAFRGLVPMSKRYLRVESEVGDLEEED